MTKEKSAWDQIPSLEGLEVDWQYKPENPLGKRSWLRMADKELLELLGVKRIPVKIVSKNFEETGVLLDVSQGGCSVVLKERLSEGQTLKLGFILGKEKVISKGMVKNVARRSGGFRIGIAFVELEKAMQDYIAGLISSKVLQRSL
jgi:hypothetical protein